MQHDPSVVQMHPVNAPLCWNFRRLSADSGGLGAEKV